MDSNTTFVIFETQYIHLVDYNEVIETSSETVVKSVDGSKTFVKWESAEIPNSVKDIPEPKQYVTYYDMIEKLNTEEWVLKFPS